MKNKKQTKKKNNLQCELYTHYYSVLCKLLNCKPPYLIHICFEHNHTPSGKKMVTGVQVITASQRREDMTSRRSDNLDALITFQGQESRMQATRMALWTKSRWALSVFY